MDPPKFFPSDLNRRLAGLGKNPFKKKFKIVFQDYGRCGHVDVRCSDGDNTTIQTRPNVYTSQRQNEKEPDRSLYCADVPTIPLSSVPAKVHCQLRDDVIGDLPDLPTEVTRFSRSLAQVSSAFRNGASWSRPFETGKRMLEKSSKGRRHNIRLDNVEENLPPSVSNLVHMYTDLSQYTSFQAFNAHYSGGLLSCVEDESGGNIRHLLFHATGPKLDCLALTIAAPSTSVLVPSCVVAESRVKKTFQVNAVAVQDHVFVAARHDASCSVFSVPKMQCVDVSPPGDLQGLNGATCSTSDEQNSHISPEKQQLTSIGSCDFEAEIKPTSVCLNKYIPGEGVFCGGFGIVKLWSARRGVVRTMEVLPRFECDNPWCHAYYADHPRQVVLADRTAVQMMDHRVGFQNSVDLFALPSGLVHQKEQIMAAHHHGNSGPLHVVATSHSVFVVDQRFGGSPVMHWYPDLQGPLQYLASMHYPDDHRGRRGVLLAGSQHPAEVMCYPFNHGNGHPVTTSLNPWRLSKMSDISNNQHYSCFQGASDPLLLEERLGMSVAGLAVARGSTPNSFLAYQADCYGELFFQQYSTPESIRKAVKTGVPPPGIRDHHVLPEVQNHVNMWLQRLQTQVVSLRRGLKRKKAECGQRVPACRQRLFRNAQDEPETQTTEKCTMCKKDVSIASGRVNKVSGNKTSLLCARCRHFRPHSDADEHKKKSSSSQRSLHSEPERSSGDGGYAANIVKQGLSLLDAAVPGVGGYKLDPFTSVHLELMNPQPHLTELVAEREEVYAQLLEKMKSKYRHIRERKNQRRQAEENNATAATDDVDNTCAITKKHSVFNTEEHQQQNSRISEVLSQLVKAKKPVASFQDDVYSDTDGENTPPNVVQGNINFDLFDYSESEEAAEPSQNVTQDDDDDFFGSQDLFA